MNENLIINKIPVIGALNAVEGFNPSEFLRKTVSDSNEEQMYLDVKYRKLWFRLKYPLGKITKTIVHLTEQLAIVEARVYINKEDGVQDYIANAFAQIQYALGDDSKRHLETAEISAIGQALADAGFGIQFCDSTEGNDSEMVGSGIPVTQPTEQNQPKSQEPPYNPAPQNQEPSNPNPQGQPANPVTTQQEPVQQEQTTMTNPTGATAQQEPAGQYDSTTPVEEIVKIMTLEEAKNIVVPLGFHKGKSFGQLAIEKPSAIEWYIKSYTGNDNILRAGATVLINAAMKHAS